MKRFLITLIGRLRDFFVWWGSELVDILPAWMAEAAVAPGPANTICVDRDGLRLLAEHSAKSGEAKGLVEKQPCLTAQQISARLAREGNAKTPLTVGIRIPYSFCFSRTVELPLAAEKDFARLLAVDMERATPFRSSEVFSAFAAAPGSAAGAGKIAIRQLIVKRTLLTTALAELEASGLRIELVDCWDEAGHAPLNLDFRDSAVARAPKGRSLARPILAAAGLAVALAVAGGYETLFRLNGVLAGLQAQADELRVRKASHRAAVEAANKAKATLTALETLMATPPKKLAVIDELTQILPDSAWVNDLRITADGVELNGFAQSTVALLPALEKSTQFVDASSSAAVTFDAREDKERFSLRVRYKASTAEKPRKGEVNP